MSNNVRVWAVLITVMLMTACVGSKVVIAPNAAIDPALHRTFAWEVEPIRPSGRLDKMYHIDHYLRLQATKELLDRGYQQVPRASADFLVAYRIFQSVSVDQGGIISPRDAAIVDMNPVMDPGSTELYNHFIPEQIMRASVGLSMVSTANQQPLWQASLTKIIEDDSGSEKVIRDAMEDNIPKLFRGFPSRP